MQSAGGGGAAPSVATTALHAAGSIRVFGAEATGHFLPDSRFFCQK
jgi:hypothetical protein